MKSAKNQFISYFLLLCISATIIPLNILHNHKEETHCDKTNPTLENNPCHISSYHASDFQKPHCEHKSHIDKEHNHCEFCKFITSHRHDYTATKQYSIVHDLSSQALLIAECPFFPSSVSSVIFSRGPPA